MRTYKLWYCSYSQGFRAGGCGHTKDQGFIYDESCGWITLEDDEGTVRQQETTVQPGPWPYQITINGILQTPHGANQPCPEHTGCAPHPPSVGERGYG